MRGSRRSFLVQLTTLALGRLARHYRPGIARRRAVPLHGCHVAGFRYHSGPSLLGRMRAGEPIRLSREPGNRYDPWAVRLDYRGRKIGYLPRQQNQPVARLLDSGARVRARIAAVDRRAEPWRAVRIEVALVEAAS